MKLNRWFSSNKAQPLVTVFCGKLGWRGQCFFKYTQRNEEAIFFSFVDTSGEVLSGETFTLRLEASQTLTVPVLVGVRACYDDDVTLLIGGSALTLTTVQFIASSSSGQTTNIVAQSSSVKSRVVDFYITHITPTMATSDEFATGETTWLRYIINTNEWTPFFPNDIYPDGSDGAAFEAIESSSFEYFVFLESPLQSGASTTQIDIELDVDGTQTTQVCTATVSETLVVCTLDLTTHITTEAPVTLDLMSSFGDRIRPPSYLRDAYYSLFPSTGQADGTIVHFNNGLKVVKEDADEVEITIVTEDGFSANGAIELEVFPENPNSYIVSPTTISVASGATVATVTVTVINDDIDEGEYESFRIKIADINGASNVASTFASDEGLRFVIVDDDIAEVTPETSEIRLTEDDDCYDVKLEFDSPAAVSQRGEYRVCSSDGVLLQSKSDDRDIVYSCSYDIPEHSCKSSLCFCTFDDLIPEPTETFFIFPIPPEVSSASGQVLRVTIEDDDFSNDATESISSVSSTGSSLNEDSGNVEIVITASGSISGLFELAPLFGTAELNVDYTISSATFSNEAMATATLTILQDDVYEGEQCVTLVPRTSPVEIDDTVDNVEICWDDTDVAIGLYPESAVGYVGCSINFVVFSKSSKNAGNIMLSEQIINGLNDADCTLSSAVLTNGLGFSTLSCIVTTSLTSLESFYEVEITATGTGFTSKETATFTVKPFNTAPSNNEYHAAQDQLACFEVASPSCDVPICRRTMTALPSEAYDSMDGTAVSPGDYTSVSGTFALADSTDMVGIETPVTVTIDTAPFVELAEDFTVELTAISESVTVIILPDPDQAIRTAPPSITSDGFKHYVLEGDLFFIPELSDFQINRIESDNINPFGFFGTREITATADCDFKLVEDPQSGLVYVNILQDGEIEGIEEFVVFIDCNVAYPTAVFFSATICIVDDDKEEKKFEVSTEAYQSTTDQASTTDFGSTTDIPSTTDVPSTTRIESTTNIPSTTKEESTTNVPSTTKVESSTIIPSTTKVESTTEVPSTTNIPSTTREESTTNVGSTTNIPSTTQGESTTELRSTTDIQSTTNARSTTNMLSSTENPSTTNAQSTTDHVSTTLDPSSTARESTTDSRSTTVGISTTFVSTTLGESTTLKQSTTLEPTTTIMQTTQGVITTVAEATTAGPDASTGASAPEATTGAPEATTGALEATTGVSEPTRDVTTSMTTGDTTGPSVEITTIEFSTAFRGNCLTGQFSCSDGTCIEGDLLCDDLPDCSDDETNCDGSCAAVMPPANGFQVYSQTTGRRLYLEGMTISFDCNSGYTLVGNAVLTCENSNFGQVPVCRENCPPPENVDPDATPSVMSSSFDHGSTIDYTCAGTFETTLTCNNGNWDGTFPDCPDWCSSIECDENAQCQIDDNHNPFCTCNSGFSGNGTVCTDVDECQEGSHDCEAPSVCINSPPGSFTCGNPQLTAFSLRRDNNSEYEPILSELIQLPESFYISILEKKHLLFTENGVISFLSEGMDPPNSFEFSNPVDIYRLTDPLVAPFWGSFISAQLKHRIYKAQNPEDKASLTVIGTYVREWDKSDFASSLPFIPTWAIVISWENAKHTKYSLPGTYLQCAITTDGSHTFALMTYQSVQWPAAEKLVLGYNTGTDFYEIDQLENVINEEMDEPVYDLHEAIGNSNLPGRWVFRLDSNDPSNTKEKQSCVSIFKENLDHVPTLENVKECPSYISSMKGFQFDTCSFVLSSQDDATIYGRPKQSFCLSQKILSTYPDSSPGSYCWYDSDGYLMDTISNRNVWESTVVQRIHPRQRIFQKASQEAEWIRNDIEFRYHCCVASDSDDHCDLYESIRPSPSAGEGSTEYSPSGVYGAGHYVTLDGQSYTFNGIGEFVLLRIEEAAVQIQARSQIPRTASRGNATIITRIAVQLENDLIEFTAGSDGSTMKTFSNGVEIATSELTKGYKASGRLSVSLGPDAVNHSIEVMDVVMLPTYTSNVAVEIFVRINIVSGSLNYLMTVSENAMQRGSTEGLLGVYNGNSSDDFLFPDGHHLITGDGIVSGEEIEQFGNSWRTTQSTSIFSYGSNEEWSMYNDVDFSATFYEDLLTRSDLSSEFEQASEMCNEIQDCVYDFITLENSDIALSTKYIHEIFQNEKRAKENHPPRVIGISEVEGDTTSPGINEEGVLLIAVGRTYKYSIETEDQDNDDTVIISLDEGPLGANIEEDGTLLLTLHNSDAFELVLRVSDGLSSTLHKLTVWVCECDFNGECFYGRLWEEDVVRRHTFSKAYCLCEDGFIARSCSFDEDRCEQNPCYPGVTCIDPGRPEPVQCSDCPTGMVGDGFHCQVSNDCAGQNTCEQLCNDTPEHFVCSCRSGFELLPNGYSCQDIDECKRQESLCDYKSICRNTEGSYHCICRPGYRSLEGTLICLDIDECRNENPCDENEICVNDDGSYHCECEAGFIRVNNRCVDLNECFSPSLNDCHNHATCTNLIGSYKCTCKEGYQGNGRVCRDIEECHISPFYCHPRFDCENTEGSYICSCPTGFDGNGDDCFDIDECHLGIFNCADNEICINRVGYYLCECDIGFSVDGDGHCANINECNQSPCPTNSECIDSPGSFRCSCLAGYFKEDGECLSITEECSGSALCKNPTCIDETCSCEEGFFMDDLTGQCIDSDECEEHSHDCDEDAYCTNIPDSYTCTCNEGYTGNGTLCEDKLECDDGNLCNENSRCQELPGSYHCVCQEGFQGNGESCVGKHNCDEEGICPVNSVCIEEDPGFRCDCPRGFQADDGNCIDIDECTNNPCAENATCHNTDGSFYCSCSYGYFGDGRIEGAGCQDINECQVGLAVCPENSICENGEGIYNCYCREGFKLEGDFCFDIDECSEGSHDCDGNATCINLPATYTCRCNIGFFHQETQPQIGYATVGTCKDIDECALGTFQCSENAVCQNEAGSYSCSCKEGFLGNGTFCTDTNECRSEQPCSNRPRRSCLNRIGSYRCICEVGSYQDESGSCVDSNSIELRIEFSDIKGIRTQFALELVTEDVLEELSKDIKNLFSGSIVSEYVHQVLAIDVIRSDNHIGLVTVRIDFDLKANMTIQTASNLFGNVLVGRNRNIVPPDSIVNDYSVFYAESNLCLDGRHDCYQRGYERCIPTEGGTYICEGCQFGYRLENGSCLSDPCITGANDCSDRFYDSCQYSGNGQFSCENCQSGFFQTETRCVPDPCETGIRTCDKLNFRQCISDGNNQFHCETCKPGFELQNGGCTPVNEDNPCTSLENTCQERNFQTCVFDGDGKYHCEKCMSGYRQESEVCIADPCQVGQNDCRERNFERCRYESGGLYNCEKCQAGYELRDFECIYKESPVKRYRGKMRITAMNDSSSLAAYREELAKTDTSIFKVYEHHICSIMSHVLSSQNYLGNQNYDDCFVYQYRNGSIIPYFAVDFLQNEITSDLSIRLKEALVRSGQTTPEGLLLSNTDRSGNILVETDSVEFLDTSTYGCNRNSVCTNGGTCVEDTMVYEYHCRCPPNFQGKFCQMVANSSQPQPSTTLAPPLVEGNEFPAWSIALLALAAILSFCLCVCCACLFLSTRRGVESSKGMYYYQQPLRGVRESVPLRNRLIQARREVREVPCRNPLYSIDDDDEGSRLEARDQKKMQQLSDILNHAEFLNNRMRNRAENGPDDVVYNHYIDVASEQAREFTRPHLVDGSEAKVPSLSARMEEYVALSESSSNSVFKPDGSISSESSF